MAFSLGGIGAKAGSYIKDTFRGSSKKPIISTDTPKKPFVIYANIKKPENLTNIFPGTNIPLDIILIIFQQFNLRDLRTFCCVSKEWNRLGSHPFFSKPAFFKEFAFGPNHWNTHCGENTISQEESKEAFDLLPDNINEILKSPCQAFPGYRIMKFHRLVWIPKKINDQMFKGHFLGEFLEHFLLENPIQSGWVLMTEVILPKSSNKSYAEQCVLLKSLNKSGITDYTIPNVVEIIICIWAEYSKTNIKLLNENLIRYTRCQSNGRTLRIGCFGENDIKFSYDDFNSYTLGMVGMWRFPEIDPWIIL